MVIITSQPINLSELIARLPREGAGSIVFHAGVVKAKAGGKPTRGIVFADKGGLEQEIRDLEIDLRSRWSLEGAVLCRRLGKLGVGDLIMVVAVAAADRETAFAACREGVEGFKSLKELHKEELVEG